MSNIKLVKSATYRRKVVNDDEDIDILHEYILDDNLDSPLNDSVKNYLKDIRCDFINYDNWDPQIQNNINLGHIDDLIEYQYALVLKSYMDSLAQSIKYIFEKDPNSDNMTISEWLHEYRFSSNPIYNDILLILPETNIEKYGDIIYNDPPASDEDNVVMKFIRETMIRYQDIK